MKKFNISVYDDIDDNGKSTSYGLVLGNSMLIKERVSSSVFAYKKGRIKKIIFSGGVNGVSNQDGNSIPEAIRMKELAIKMGVKETDILIDDISNNTFENIDNSLKLIDEDIASIAIITSEFHLKRCMAIIKKNYPKLDVILIKARDGFSDYDNWFLSDDSWNSGRSLATFEANILIKYAKENKIYDLEI